VLVFSHLTVELSGAVPSWAPPHGKTILLVDPTLGAAPRQAGAGDWASRAGRSPL